MRKYFQCLTLFFLLSGIIIPQTLNKISSPILKPNRSEIEKTHLRIMPQRDIPNNFHERLFHEFKDNSLRAGKLDTIYHPQQITVDDSLRYNYTYDDSGNVKESVTQIDSNGTWRNHTRHTNTYSSSNKILTDLWEIFENGVWVNYAKYTYTYDNKNNQLSEFFEIWQNNAWANYWIVTMTYDANGNMLSWLYKQWQNGVWVNMERYTMTYDNNNNELTYLKEVWQNGAWAGVYRYAYSYDKNNNQDSALTQIWQNGAWVNFSREKYYNDKNSNLDSSITQNWKNNAWVNYTKDIYTHDSTGRNQRILWEYWNNNSWAAYARDTLIYNSRGNMVSSLWEVVTNGKWVNDTNYGYIFDINGNATHGEILFWQSEAWVAGRGTLMMHFNNGKDEMDFYDVSFVDIQYTSITAGLASEKIAVKSFSLEQNYPNPFNPATTISYFIPKDSWVKLTVFDVLGNEVRVLENSYKTSGNYKVEFNAAGMPSDVYFYRLEAGEFSLVKKLLLLK